MTIANSDRLRVLLIEDNLLDQRAFTRLVHEERLPYEYVLALTVAEAKHALAHDRFDVILVDHALADGTGFEAVDAHLTTTPTIFITGSGNEAIAVEALKAGAANYLIKDVEGLYLKLLPMTVRKAVTHHRIKQALAASDERLRLVMEGTNDGIWDWNLLTNAHYTSPRWKEIVGYRENELPETEAAFFDRLHPDDHTVVRDTLRQHLDERVPYGVEVRMRHKDGSYRWCLMRGEAVRNAQGRPIRMVASLTDITDRKRVEQALKESYADLERRVQERTAELVAANVSLQAEVTERKRAEDSLWKHQQAIRALYDITAIQGHSFEERVEALLQLGCRLFNLPIAIVAELKGHEFEVSYACASRSIFTPGLHIPVEATPCGATLHSDGPLSVEDLAHSDWSANPGCVSLGIGCYLGSKLRGADQLYGCLSFMDTTGRAKPFTSFDKDFVQLMAGWLGSELDRQYAENARKDNERALVTAQTLAHLGSWVWDIQTGLNIWSDEHYRILGYEPQSIKPGYDVFAGALHSEDRERVLLAAKTAVEEGVPFDQECRIVQPGGEVRHVHYRGEVIPDDGGRPFRMAGTLLDISERKAAEQALQSAYQQLSFHMENTPLAVVEWEPDFRVRRWSAQASKMFGWGGDEVIGKHPQAWQFVFEDDQRMMTDISARLMGGLERRNIHRIRVNTKAGTVLHCIWYNSVLTDEHGSVVSMMSLIQDLSEHVRLEWQFQREQKMEAIGRLAGGIAHDFNNLLTVINGYSDLLLSKRVRPDGVQDVIGQILGAGQRAASLTRQLLAFSQQQVLQLQVLDFNTIVSNMEKMLRRLIGEDIKMTLVLDRAAGRIRADPGQIEQVVMNLVVNARDAMPHGGHLAIRTNAVVLDQAFLTIHAPMLSAGSYAMLEVSDSGVGMSEATAQLIFEPFFTTKGGGKGTGLGLATAHGIVQQSQGVITVSSQLGRGTSFQVYFPRHFEALTETASVPRVQPVQQGTETILLVEDEPVVRTFARQVLLDAGYTVLESGTAEEAVFLSNGYEQPIHLLLSDVVLPGVSGPALRDLLRGQRAGIHVLLMSGYVDRTEGAQEALAEGTMFLQKPFTSEVLLQKVRDVLDGPLDSSASAQLSLLD